MKVSIQSLNFNAAVKLLNFTEKKVASLTKFHDKILKAEVFFKIENSSDKENKITEIKINIPGNELVVKKQFKSFEEGISIGVETLKRRLKKSKEKLLELVLLIFKLLLKELNPRPAPIPRANLPDLLSGISLINPKFILLEKLFSFRSSMLSFNEL